jgi:agmatinase
MLRQLRGLNLAGAALVEVAPAYDHAEITSVAAATVVFDLVSLMVAGARTTADAMVTGDIANGVSSV